MNTSTFCKRLYSCFLVVVLCLASTMANTSSLKSILTKRQPEASCDDSEIVSLICYQCGMTHPVEFGKIFTACCSGEEGMDLKVWNYCKNIFREPPKRGGNIY